MVSLRLMVIAKQWEKFVENLGCQKTADVPEPFRGFAQLPFFLLNQQYVRFWNSETEPHEGLLREGDCPETSWNQRPTSHVQFLLSKWICVPFLIVTIAGSCLGDADLMRIRFVGQKKGNPDDCIWKGKLQWINEGCAARKIRWIQNRRDESAKALYWANVSFSMQMELDSEMWSQRSPSVQGLVPWNLLETAAGIVATEVVKERLTSTAFDESQFLLHTALMFEGGSPEMISTLNPQHCCDVQFMHFFPHTSSFRWSSGC